MKGNVREPSHSSACRILFDTRCLHNLMGGLEGSLRNRVAGHWLVLNNPVFSMSTGVWRKREPPNTLEAKIA